MASQILKSCLKGSIARCKQAMPLAASCRSAHHGVVDYELEKIGNREVVGYGLSGDPNYLDKVMTPFPAIRFKSYDTAELKALKEKEKGDWRKLTVAEKKALYRASFCQTFAEMEAPTGQWKSIFGCTLIYISMGIWLMYGIKEFGFGPLPRSFNEDRRSLQLQRLLDMEYGIIEGLSSQYDYEKEQWKK
ncbi:cytochrome c oxidase subunit 4 isoform 2, mitochondrial [Nilaparvata lugens]|uniref:cytochrome c oxidase subunit 4 isoform 2, mitochondrial n=1 Tax=Nilaparvata lugens TaxID=108931 RepID=UPI000B98F9E2|nr:cytochrome c oxidase subunit 4 isoform 2, mitochondrial [Nilaparvata lugens]XP_039293159.1 cytochrome c oxidase subunit 4 isoform 2, mitochondrial [Nilaparvata lugens]